MQMCDRSRKAICEASVCEMESESIESLFVLKLIFIRHTFGLSLSRSPPPPLLPFYKSCNIWALSQSISAFTMMIRPFETESQQRTEINKNVIHARVRRINTFCHLTRPSSPAWEQPASSFRTFVRVATVFLEFLRPKCLIKDFSLPSRKRFQC